MGREHIAFGAESGYLLLFRLSDGELVWSDHLPDVAFTPVVDGSRLYVPCGNGTLVVFEAEGGDL